MRKVIKRISSYIAMANRYTKDEEEQVEYAMRITVFEFLKVIAIMIIFSLMGYPIHAITATFTMAVIKPFIGGYHEDTQIKCFIATLIVIGSIIYLSINLRLDIISKLILSGVTCYCIWHQAPIINLKMKLIRPDLIKRNRVIGIGLTVIFLVIAIIFYEYKDISDAILWTVVFQTLLMFNKGLGATWEASQKRVL